MLGSGTREKEAAKQRNNANAVKPERDICAVKVTRTPNQRNLHKPPRFRYFRCFACSPAPRSHTHDPQAQRERERVARDELLLQWSWWWWWGSRRSWCWIYWYTRWLVGRWAQQLGTRRVRQLRHEPTAAATAATTPVAHIVRGPARITDAVLHFDASTNRLAIAIHSLTIHAIVSNANGSHATLSATATIVGL